MIRIRQIKVPIKSDALKESICKKLNINSNELISFSIHKKSIDARKKDNIYYVYEIDANIQNEELFLKKNKNNDIFKTPDEAFKITEFGNKPFNQIVIVGSGPSGLFASYILSEYGYKPIIIEQGSIMEKRIEDVDNFIKTGILNPLSNVQFGEGGAGTFSDGKLNTLKKDPEFIARKVFEIFVSCGADEEILYSNKPHIGTDILRNVIINMRKKIISMGGEIYYDSKLTNINISNNKIESIEINSSKTIKTDILILALGNSSRDTFYMLNESGLNMESKPFAVGLRISHPQELIDNNQYGTSANLLPHASYKLTYQTKDKRGVYSFCMCPGGYVINSSSEKLHLVTNGMSNHKRDSKIANAAIVVTVSKEDYGSSLFDGIKYQLDLESKAYNLTKGLIPVQYYKDFKDDKLSKINDDSNIKTKGAYQEAKLNEILPSYIKDSLIEAIEYFSTKIKSFNKDDAILYGVETRTSCPIRIIRDNNLESNIKGIYPIGEGAGYAGGITTCAMDGIKVARTIIKNYKNNE